MWGPNTVPLACMPCGGCVPRGWRGAGPGEGGLPPLRGASGVRRRPSPSRSSSGAGGRGSATRVSRVRSVPAWGPSTGPTACAPGGRRCSLWGWQKGVPGEGAFHHCEGRLRSGAVSPPTARPLGGLSGSDTHVLWARVCGCGGPTLPLGLHAPWGLRAAGLVGGRPRGGWPATVMRGAWCQALSLPRPPALWGGWPGFCDPCVPGTVGAGVGTQHRLHSVRPCGPALLAVGVAEEPPRGAAFHHCEGRLVSGAVPSPAARPLERVARVPRPVCPGYGRCWRGDPAPAPQRAPLRAGVARPGGGGKGFPGGGAFHHCEGRLRSGAVSPPTARPLGMLLGSATHVLWALCGCGGPTLSPWPACPFGAACRRGGWGAVPGGGGLPPL